MNKLFRVIYFLSELFLAYGLRECILAHADRIRLTAVHKIGVNWFTQEVCSEVTEQTFLWNGL